MDKAVEDKLNEYPEVPKTQLLRLRALIIQVAAELELGKVDESLKWGEPSYHVKMGSPIRIDWKEASPNHYYLFFNCQTKLVETCRELYGDVLVFKGNRAIVLDCSTRYPEQELKHCIQLALTYQKVKHLSLLGC